MGIQLKQKELTKTFMIIIIKLRKIFWCPWFMQTYFRVYSYTIRPKSSFLFLLLDVSITCQHVHELELHIFF